MPQPKTEPKNRSLSEIPFHKYSTLPSDYSTRWGDRKDAGPLSSMILEEEESDRESEGDAFGYGFKEEKKEDLSWFNEARLESREDNADHGSMGTLVLVP